MLFRLGLLGLIGAIGWADRATGPDIGLSLFYLLPVVGAGWGTGRAFTVVAAVAASAAWFTADVTFHPTAVGVSAWNGLTRLAIFSAMGLLVVRMHADRDRIASVNERLNALVDREATFARIDPLTQLPNSRAFREALRTELARSRRAGSPICLLYLDLDHFKRVNDRRGHAAGDDVLRRVGGALRDTLRASDIAGRLGGDEFGVLLWNVAEREAGEVARRLVERIGAIGTEHPGTDLGASVGVAYFRSPPDDEDALVQAADGAMYEAKRAGRNRSVVRAGGGPVAAEAPVVAPAPAPAPAPLPADRAATGTLPSPPPRRRDAAPSGAASPDDASPAPAGPAIGPGSRVGRYEVVREIARGGMGVVYRARDPAGGSEVALKVMLRSGDPGERARFLREIEAASLLVHPHICQVRDMGEVDGHPFFAMELIEGVPLNQHVRQVNADARSIVTLVGRVCEAIEYAHMHGVIHRDLKPPNILVDGRGEPRVMDFGIAKRLGPEGARGAAGVEEGVGASLTGTGMAIGTPTYMSPEQAAGRSWSVDVRTDVYALGVILYELTTGQRPFRGATVDDVLRQVLEGEAAPPRSLRPDLDPDLEAIILKAMAKDPDGRYQSAAELKADIRRFLIGLPVQARTVGVIYRARKLVRRRPGAVAAAALVLAGATGGVAHVVALHRTREEAEARARRDLAAAARELVARGRELLHAVPPAIGSVAEADAAAASVRSAETAFFQALAKDPAAPGAEAGLVEAAAAADAIGRRREDLVERASILERLEVLLTRAEAELDHGAAAERDGEVDAADALYRAAVGRARDALELAPQDARARALRVRAGKTLASFAIAQGRFYMASLAIDGFEKYDPAAARRLRQEVRRAQPASEPRRASSPPP